MDDLDAWLEECKPRTVEVSVCGRGDLLEQHTAAEAALTQAGSPDEMRELAERVQAIEAEIQAATRTFRFRSVSTLEWTNLLAQHPPTKDQLKADPLAEFNPETFPPAAVAACSADGITIEQAQRLHRTLREGEWRKIWSAVLQVNLGAVDPPKSLLAGAVLRSNGASGITRADMASPAASS